MNKELTMEKKGLPVSWELKKISDLFDIKSSKRVHKADWKENGVPFYRAREVVKLAEYDTVDNALFISEELYEEFIKEKGAPKEGDIIISAVGTLGKCYLVKSSDRFYFKDASVLWFENISNVDTRYIEYAFKSDEIMKQVMNKSMGATVGTLTISRAKIIEIPLPPLTQQKQIVAILDKAFAAIDTAKANAEQNQQNAKELFESYLQNVFENKGDNWEEKALGEFGLVQTGTTPKTSQKENYGSFIPFAKPPHFKKNGQIDTKESYLSEIGMGKSRVFPANSVLMVCIGATIGKTGFSDKAITSNQQINGLTPNDEYYPRFFYYLFISGNVQKQIMSIGKGAQATLPIINKTKWSNINLTFPNSIEEQKQIVQKLDLLSLETKKLEAIYTQKIADLEEMKKAILEKAFKGELTSAA